jgi:hypothetical protein
MRRLVVWLAGAALLGCSTPAAAPQTLDGVWRLETVHSPLDPHTLTLSQHDGTVTGTGTAMGVDVPVAVTVTGTVSLPAVALTFDYGDGVARYTATLQSGGRLVGQAVYDPTFGGVADSLTFAKQ